MSTSTPVSPVADLETPLKFAYWVPNVSGGLVVSTIEQRTSWDFDYNKKLARIAENSGFEYALTQTRYAASYGADKQHEATSFSLALLAATEWHLQPPEPRFARGFSAFSGTVVVTVAEITTSARGLTVEVPLPGGVGLDDASVVNCDGLHTVAQSSLTSRVGEVDDETLVTVCGAVTYALGC